MVVDFAAELKAGKVIGGAAKVATETDGDLRGNSGAVVDDFTEGAFRDAGVLGEAVLGKPKWVSSLCLRSESVLMWPLSLRIRMLVELEFL